MSYDTTPVIPSIQRFCQNAIASDQEQMRPKEAMDLERLCEKAMLEIYIGNKPDLAALVFTAATGLFGILLPHTALFLHNLVGRETIQNMLEPMQKDGWEMRDCPCSRPECPGYIIAVGYMFDNMEMVRKAIRSVANDMRRKLKLIAPKKESPPQ